MVEIVRNIGIFVAMLGGLVVIHEAGHWLACGLLGIEVKEFGIGLPPRMVRLGEWRGTVISLNWLLIGGFVRPKGETDPTLHGGLAASAPWRRLIVFAAGPLANFALAFLVFTIGFTLGWPERVKVLDVIPGSPAEQAGLKVDDLILTADGLPIRYPDALSTMARSHLHTPIALVVQRQGSIFTTNLTPDTSWSKENLLIGVAMQRSIVAYPLPRAITRAGEEMVNQFTVTGAAVAKLVQGSTPPAEQPRVVGIVGLKQLTDRAVDNSVAWEQWFPILNLIAVVSTALGIANLLPFPALDGGRIALTLWGIASRRRFNPNIERWANVAGLVVLLGLMVVLAVHDIAEPIYSH